MPRGQILIVDDEVSILKTLKTALSLEGYLVDLAANVSEARQHLEKRSYDVLLLDVALPDGNGVDLLEQLRAQSNDTQTIMMSGHASIDVAVRATRLGALDFLEKPVSTDRLLVVIENTLRLIRAEHAADSLRQQVGYFDELLGESRAMKELRDQVTRAAKANASVLLTGERGTGKELVARAIHRASPRAKEALEKLNCAAVPSNLIESELFGHEAGAFTGATKQRRGKFERAHGGTLFLDEVGDMPLEMQAKLLRVLQEHEIERVGGTETINVDVRVVAATNRNLTEACKSGAFRPDLYDRLNVLPLTVPPLRVRREDIPLLAQHFLALARNQNNRPGVQLSDKALEQLTQHSFPGNVRELSNLIERLVILSPDDLIETSDISQALGMSESPKTAGLFRQGIPFRVLVEEAERTILEEALSFYGGQMAATARGLSLERSHLYKKTKALGLRGNKENG